MSMKIYESANILLYFLDSRLRGNDREEGRNDNEETSNDNEETSNDNEETSNDKKENDNLFYNA